MAAMNTKQWSIARRGKCSHIWRDHSRNSGTDKQFGSKSSKSQLTVTSQTTSTVGTQWHYIPANGPHHAELWDASVKSIKYHLNGTVTTYVTSNDVNTSPRAESYSNSRPLHLDDIDPDNINPLTPGYFFNGETVAGQLPDTKEIKMCNLSRWQHTQKLVKDLWRRWRDELSRLQQRHKWMKEKKEMGTGDNVLIKTDKLPPGKWSFGKFVD